jgi:hypothetical protein
MIVMPNCLITYTGRQFDILNPRPEDVCIEDVEKKVHVAILDSLGMPAPTAEEQRIVDYIDDWLLCLEMETIMNSSSQNTATLQDVGGKIISKIQEESPCVVKKQLLDVFNSISVLTM